MNLLRWFNNPNIPPSVNKKNFIRVQIDAVGIGLAGAASPFLPIFLTRLNASSLQVSMLTAMPALTGLLLAIPVGRFLQSRRNIVPWFSAARLAVVTSYALTGIVPFIFPREQIIIAILAIWALATIPQTVVAIGFSVVMNSVAGPAHRYELMTRRWSILGFTTSVTVIAVGQLLDRLGFPFNYQIVFLALSVGGLISYYYSSHIDIPDTITPSDGKKKTARESMAELFSLVRGQPAFLSFTAKRFVFLFGVAMTAPVFPLYFVHAVKASDAAISFINTAQTAILILGYFFWSTQSRRHGSRRVLVWATLGLAIYPALVAQTHQVAIIVVLAGFAGIFQAGIDLVFFDELMKTVPIEYSATFVAVAQSLQYMSAIVAPVIGSTLSETIGLSGALEVSTVLRLLGFALFALSVRKTDKQPLVEADTE